MHLPCTVILVLLYFLLLLLPNTDSLQQTDDYIRCCTTSTKYWQPSTNWRLYQMLYYFYQILTAFNKLTIISDVVLLLPNTDSLQQTDDYIRCCTTSTKYWQSSTSWLFFQRLCYLRQILTAFNKLTIISEVVLLLPNTDSLQQTDDYIRGCTTSTKHWQPSTNWRLCQRLYYFYQILTAFNKMTIMSEIVLLLPNIDSLQQTDDYVRGCTTSTKYWQPSTTWRLCQRLYYFYQILTAFNKLTIMSEIVLLLPNTDRLQYTDVYVRGCTTSTKYWQPSTTWRLCQRLYYFYQILTAFNKLTIVRGCTTSTKYWQPSTSWRLCQKLYYFYQILTAFNNLTIMSEVVLLLPNTNSLQQPDDYVRGCTTSTKYWQPSTTRRLCQKLYYFCQILTAFNNLTIMSEVVLLLPNTDSLQQTDDYIRCCTTSTKYWQPSTNWRLYQMLYYFYQILTAFNKLTIISDVVLLLPNTDSLQQADYFFRGCATYAKYWQPSTKWRLYQWLYYFYQILTAFSTQMFMSEVVLPLPNTDSLQQPDDYVRGCTTSTKYWQPSTSWRLCQKLYYFYQILTAFNNLTIMSEVVLLLPNTNSLQQPDDYVRGCTTSTKYWQPSTTWRLCQKLYYFYQILTAFNNLTIMSEIVLLLPNTDSLQQVDDYVRNCTTSTKY